MSDDFTFHHFVPTDEQIDLYCHYRFGTQRGKADLGSQFIAAKELIAAYNVFQET